MKTSSKKSLKGERDFRIVSMRKNLDNFLLTRKLDMPDESET